jgi:hypothetical protein
MYNPTAIIHDSELPTLRVCLIFKPHTVPQDVELMFFFSNKVVRLTPTIYDY